MAEPRMVREQVASWDSWELEGTVESLIDRLYNMTIQGHKDLTISYESEWDGPGRFVINGMREEMAKERDKRLIASEKARERKAKENAQFEERERKEYEKLKDKYGTEG